MSFLPFWVLFIEHHFEIKTINMKYLYSIVLLLLLQVVGFGQVIEKNVTMSLGNNNAFIIDLPGADKGMTEKLLKEHLKDYGKFEKNKKAKEFFVVDTRIPVIASGSQIGLYFKIDEGKDISNLTMWVDNGSAFVSSDDNAEQANGAEIFLTDFSYVVAKEVISKELEDQEKELKNLNKDLSKLLDKNEDYHKDIEKANKKIAEAEKDIEMNLLDQDAKNEEIAKQQKLIDEIADRLNNIGRKN